MPTIANTTSGEEGSAFHGVSQGAGSTAVFGQGAAVGVRGDGGSWHGVVGISTSTTGGAGVHGQNRVGGAGVIGESTTWIGVYGRSEGGEAGGSGVMGEHMNSGPGVHGRSRSGAGVFGLSDSGPALYGVSETHEGVHAESRSPRTAAVAAYQNNAASSGAALFARHAGAGPAGLFQGNVVVTGSMDVSGDIRLVGADLAEQFTVAGDAPPAPGSVMVLAGADTVRVGDTPYDRRVAGVVSGAGAYRPALVLDGRADAAGRCALALSGKVCVLVDADYGPVEVGDLLTSSATPGHAMVVRDPGRALGSVIGKALDPLPAGRGLIRALVALQ